ncbi:type 2 isopentenyl-diphosphate Delta-isomerase [Fluoribacter dumoffii]|uniref:Isopentenyl-diphosphate delta-isomerase n=1 Tax=Fluoribacter dumoffii TaxID=463 RepID=A0A377G5Q0_9GAMM|nr:type 2 isopentenyl-diphosphate Delta-isomerase [Fluoribacter dumoffii]KTC91670.1 isopentenyl pyrophosphate isomerase [Fluoribacter dumoffii NY 23]MCW8417290.1 type 2 isopentenyl-diphosphate Delta-isomerase [Fluoribacter dumoffii]MCW8454869.1 type 2 isopentenyl-diphosphate Delta-isomerase [Fluoribacter dumoffii]MCW8461054.1 type 2 isopentenyl-diphosphate Delta-isomerase [Fluoribacter dumoffii]MCW8484495.1 type 2 isopentenyl-diphosphate Delta-isomerase [Fluoribacter dumoffii]
MANNYEQFEQRKQDHIKLALMPENQTAELSTFDSINLIHDALPDLNFAEISIKSSRFGQAVEKPFLISSMTAGHRHAKHINRNLIEACALNGWAMGVGSQRRELTDPKAAFEWQHLRRDFPQVSLYSNLGIAQLITHPLSDIQRLTDALQANALIIHCNPLQECMQPEGTTDYKGCWEALANAVKNLSLPIIVKETGCGFSRETMMRLNDIGIAAIDVGGLGGTHWGRIEGHRATQDPIRQKAAITFRNWGIDTATSVKHAVGLNLAYEIWGSGGVNNGLNAAKLFALGATTVGYARPMLEPALESSEQVSLCMQTIEYELKVTLFCTGSRELGDLRKALEPAASK